MSFRDYFSHEFWFKAGNQHLENLNLDQSTAMRLCFVIGGLVGYSAVHRNVPILFAPRDAVIDKVGGVVNYVIGEREVISSKVLEQRQAKVPKSNISTSTKITVIENTEPTVVCFQPAQDKAYTVNCEHNISDKLKEKIQTAQKNSAQDHFDAVLLQEIQGFQTEVERNTINNYYFPAANVKYNETQVWQAGKVVGLAAVELITLIALDALSNALTSCVHAMWSSKTRGEIWEAGVNAAKQQLNHDAYAASQVALAACNYGAGIIVGYPCELIGWGLSKTFGRCFADAVALSGEEVVGEEMVA